MKRIRNTIQRDVVFQAVGRLVRQHPNADAIYQAVIAEHPHISRATVYRNLNILCEMGLIRRLSIQNGADRFDANLEHHAHFQCRQCQRIFDVAWPLVDTPALMMEKGFMIDEDIVLFRGLCPECVEKKEGDLS